MKIHIHQTHHTIADFDAVFESIKKSLAQENSDGLHLFPELFLTGYPLQDLCLQKSFIEYYLSFLERINKWSLSLESQKTCLLLGGLQYTFTDELRDIPYKIENVIFKLIPGEKLTPIYTKMLLPNYDIFDEKKYFVKGDTASILEFEQQKIGLLICEDMWHSNVHQLDPVDDLLKLNQKLDLVVNLSASPYNLHKQEKRYGRGIEISSTLKAPFIYVNRVGTEDEIIFDGNSFIANGDRIENKMPAFREDLKVLDSIEFNQNTIELSSQVENTWEDLFSANLIRPKGQLPILNPLNDNLCQEIIDALCFGVQEYAAKNNFSKFVVALSGGLDSSLVLTLLKLSLKENQSIEAIYMPSEYSRDISLSASQELCKNLEVPLSLLPIDRPYKLCRDLFIENLDSNLEGIADENIQSRLRGLLLFARSNQTNALVINTSNKSELSVGYSTLYGDSVGALSLLGDIYKSEAYELSKYINRKYQNLIPEEIIIREPSAELRLDQVDSDSLPPYERTDAILEGVLSYRLSIKDLLAFGFDKIEIEKVINLYRKTEYKRAQFCPILKIKSKSFGFGYRVPLSFNSSYYLEN